MFRCGRDTWTRVLFFAAGAIFGEPWWTSTFIFRGRCNIWWTSNSIFRGRGSICWTSSCILGGRCNWWTSNFMFCGRRKEFEAPGHQTCGETLNRNVGIQHYARFPWQAQCKSRNRNVGHVQKKNNIFLFFPISSGMTSFFWCNCRRKRIVTLDSNVMIGVFAWGARRFWPRLLSWEIANRNVTGRLTVILRRFAFSFVVAGAVFGEPL